MRRLVEYRIVVSLALSALAGAIGPKVYPFPSGNVFIALIHERQSPVYAALSYVYVTLWFSTSFLMLSGAFSLAYIFVARSDRPNTSRPLPPYPAPESRDDLFLVLGERHRQTSPTPATAPSW